MTNTSARLPTTEPQDTERLPRLLRAMGAIERVGNALPHPFWLFWILAIALGLASAILSWTDVSVTSPADGKVVEIHNLFSGAGLQMAVSTAIDNFAEFPPMATIVVVIMGVALAERTGFLQAVMRVSISRVPTSMIVFAVAFAGTMAHVASAAAYVILVPLGGLAFRAVGRSPILGIVVAYTAIASGYDASPIPTPNDAIFAGITTAAAKTIDPEAYVSPLSNWFFNIASSIVLATVITVVTKLVLSRRSDLEPDADADLGDIKDLQIDRKERRALRIAGLSLLAAIAVLVIILIPQSSPLRGEHGSLTDSPFLDGIAMIVAALFALTGIIYGGMTGSLRKPGDVPKMMAEGIRQMAPVLVLFFAIAQFLAYFDWTGVGDLVSAASARALGDLGAPPVVLFLGILLALTIINLLVTSGSAMWSLTAPILVPMMLLLHVPAETTQALFRIADSGSTAITPMSPYFVMALGFLQRYRKSAGVGTLASYTIPLAISMTVTWTVLFLVWWALGIPLGPGAPVR
ncbi:AbgT family transporter [Microlunatus soli]|uniref:Aminobenzoyl-glutamate transport protein n=1 Tax=Microlunatus soli TaxID=630515 RepID=A0A1H1V6V8_9ACTN|nr:AbgT family transporter [Microlunatus soli]SDS80462.1 aminobenzoyl-glutamate transport protein [Microlunatus soli]